MSDFLRSVTPFQDTLADIATWAAGQDLILTRTHFTGRDEMPVARWPDGTWQDFLRAARQAGIKLVWVEVRRYAAFEDESGKQPDGALSIIECPYDDDSEELDFNEENCRPLAALHLAWSYMGVLNCFLAGVRWGDPAESKSYEEADLERSLEEVIEQAKLLVELPRYTATKSREQRRRLARRLFGSEAPVGPILKQAEALTEASGNQQER